MRDWVREDGEGFPARFCHQPWLCGGTKAGALNLSLCVVWLEML